MEFRMLDTLPEVHIMGRTPVQNGTATLFWTGSGLSFGFDGSALALVLQADYKKFEPWISVEIDGAWLLRCPVQKGRSELLLLNGTAPGTVHSVRVLSDRQPIQDDPDSVLQVLGLRFEGRIVAPAAPKCRIEFVGDSITSGEGAIGAIPETDWISAFFSAERNYARITADALGADWRCVSQSGWGLVSAWDNDPRHTLPTVYEAVCGPLAKTGRGRALGAAKPYDFAAWRADAVVINLATNDGGARDNPAWHDPVTGETFKQDASPESDQRFCRAMVDFLKMLRRDNPGAALIWAYGMLGVPMEPLLRAGLEAYRAETGDTRVYYCALPDTKPDEFGAREHPGIASHQATAKALADFMRPLLGL